MMKFKNREYKDYFIDPVTAIITDKNGVIQETTIKNGRRYWKYIPVYILQIHTKYGYKKGLIIHHIDKNKLNDSLSNLVYITHSEHMSIHKIGNKNFLGKTHSKESILKTSMAKWKKIYCFELDKQWNSITEMCRELKIHKNNVTKVLKGERKHTGGFTFKLIEKEAK